MTPKSDTITAIISLNPTADPTFLAEFSNQELEEYRHRLSQTPKPAGLSNPVVPSQAQLVAAVAPQHCG